MNFIDEKLSMLEACEDKLKEMPPGDERAERRVMIDRARREIMQIGSGSSRAEKSLDEIFEKLEISS